MACVHVVANGLNAASCKHCIDSAFVDVLQADSKRSLWMIFVGAGGPAGVGLSGGSHNLVCLSRGPLNTIVFLK